MNVPSTIADYHDAIVRAASDPNFNIENLERLIKLQQQVETVRAETHWNEMMSAAQAEMAPISTNADNPQTRSRYATHAGVDREARPIYTKHGFGVTFDTERTDKADELLVVAYVSNGAIRRRYEYPVPVETTGAKGTQYTTKNWARSGAKTYGMRILLGMIFNLAIDKDDDGRAASGRSAPPPPPPPPVEPHVDPETGEASPHKIPFADGDDERAKFLQWARVMNASVESADALADVEAWVEHNKEQTAQLKQGAPVIHDRLQASINKHRNHLKTAGGEKPKPEEMKNGNAADSA